MRAPGLGAGGLVLAAALITYSSASIAAPAKRHNAKAAAPAPAPAPVETPQIAGETPAADAAPEPAVEVAKPLPRPAEPKLEAKVVRESDIEPNAAVGDDAAGRRERLRLAGGRTEVGVLMSMDVASRHFTYSDPLGRVLAPYRLSLAPIASFGLEAFPLAATNLPVLRDIGFRGRVSHAFGLGSKTPDGAKIDTNWTRFGGELVGRMLFPGPHALELDVLAGVDASYFNMSTASDVPAVLPSARTVSVRLGSDGKLLITGRFSLLLGAAYLAVTSPGAIYDQFHGSHVAGVDGNLGAGLGLLPGLEALVTGRYTRYFSRFNPKVGDTYVAGGALDQQLQFGLGVRYAH